MFQALFLIYLIWGMNWVVMKMANGFFPPIQFVAYRFLFGALILLGICCLRKLPLPERKYWPWIFLTGLLQMALNNMAAQSSMMELGAGMAALLNYSMPVWVAPMAHFILGERLTIRKGLGIASAMIGMTVLMGAPSGGSVYAIFLGFLGAIFWGGSAILFKLKLSGMKDMLPLTAWQMTSGALFVNLYTLAVPQGEVHWGSGAVLALLYNCVLASALAFFLWSYVLGKMEAGKAGTAVLGVPVVGVLGGIVFLGESLTFSVCVGMVLIFMGIVAVVTAPAEKKKNM